MFSHTKKSLYRILGGRMYLDLSLHSTLEPHAEKLKVCLEQTLFITNVVVVL